MREEDLGSNRTLRFTLKTSEHLEPGHIYTREELQMRFDIKDATMLTGIFRPRGHDSIWLFITEEMTKDRTQYTNRLRGDDLEIDGQPTGRKDKLLIEHESQGLEVILFYRNNKKEFPGAGFRYEGCFRYVDHDPGHPSHFFFRRIPG